MSDKPEKKKKKKRHDSDTAIRRFFAILMTVIALCMTGLVIYTLRHSTTDPTVREGVVRQLEASTEAEPVTEAPTEATEETEPVDPVLEAAQKTLEDMTLEEKVYQLFVVTNRELTGVYYANTAGEATRAALESKPVGGIVFDNENIFGRDQITAMIADTQSFSEIPLLVGVEEEGGYHAYLNTIGVTGYYSEMGVYGDDNERDRIYEIGSEIGAGLTGVGFNLNLAPVADPLINPYNVEIGRRAFSADPEIAAGLVTQMMDGLHSGGCMTCIKYFPGLSASTADSRYGAAVSDQTLEDVRANLLPFTTGIENGAEMVMVSHLCLPNIVGENRPADFSPEIVNDLLRGELGYQGVVITDSFQKGAIRYNYEIGAAAVSAIRAGCDMIYMPNDLEGAAQAILDAVDSGELTEARIDESVLRILMLKYSNGLE